MQIPCTFLSITHLLLISLTTLIAAFVIESIIVLGVICMLVAIMAFIRSLLSKRFWLSAASFSTIAVGIFFIIYELIFCGFGGPADAALPLCILFLGAQTFSIFATLADLNHRQGQQSKDASKNQISLKQLLVASSIFAVSFGIMEHFPTESVALISDWSVAFQHTWLVSLALSLFFLTVCGFISMWLSSRVSHSAES